MNGFIKVLTGIMGVLAIAACITTAVVIGYSMTNQEDSIETAGEPSPGTAKEQEGEQQAAVPTSADKPHAPGGADARSFGSQ